MYSVFPEYVRFPSGAMTMVPPSLATRRQVLTALRSVVDFTIGIGATENRRSEEMKPFEKMSSDAT